MPPRTAERMKHVFVLTAVASLCALPAITLAQGSMGSMSMGSKITVDLKAQNGSGETGTATLAQEGDDIVVTVSMKNPTSPTQPIHIHPGTCANLNPKPQYPLKNLSDGSSTTTLSNLKLSALETGGFAINVHDSPTDIGKYVACGDIPKM